MKIRQATRHFIESVWKVDPIEACQGRAVSLMWLSPTCTHFSKAKGTKLDPTSIKIRGLAWIAIRWAAAVKPRTIALENVEEFEKWGPLHRLHSVGCPGVACIKGCRFGTMPKNRRAKGRIKQHDIGCHGVACAKGCQIHQPIKSRAGETFRAFVAKLRRYYKHVEWRQLRACDFGAPTTRKRLFMLASDEPIRWPAPTHGPGRSTPYRTAAEPVLRTWGDGIIADHFAGGGGASSGIELALGRSPDLAINHDPQAIAMHKANHPVHRLVDRMPVDLRSQQAARRQDARAHRSRRPQIRARVGAAVHRAAGIRRQGRPRRARKQRG